MQITSNFLKIIKVLAILSLVLFVISFAIALIFGFPVTQVLRVIFGTVYVLFIPGFIWSYVFFPTKNKSLGTGKLNEAKFAKKESPLDLIERITLSIALSMALGPLLIFFLNKVGIKINFINSFLEIAGLIIAGLIVIFLTERKKTNL